MDLTSTSAISTLQSVKERIREKLNGSLKAVKLQTSLAAKIKTKTLNNSSFLKVSLKHNNKALACALTAEREKSRRLGNDKMFLQKEVKMLHFQNALLRQNLSIVNKMLKDIDIFMNINLPAAIEISNNMESSDRLSLSETKSDRCSRQSAMTLDEDQGYRLTGVALRVPSHSVGQQKCHQTILVNEENHLSAPASPVNTVGREIGKKLDEPEFHTLNLLSKEYISVCNENASRDSLSNVSKSILPLDEVFSSSNRNAQSGGFVTKRKKRSTVSQSSTVSKKSESKLTTSSTGMSSCTHWEMNTDVILPELGHMGLSEAERSYMDSVLQKDRLSTLHCASLSQKVDTDERSDAGNDFGTDLCKEQLLQNTNQPEDVLNEESNPHSVDRHVAHEKTVYDADMEMTSSECASIIALLPKNNMKASKNKSGIPVKQTGTLRKVKKKIREKTKSTGTSAVQQVNDLSNSNETGDATDKSVEDLMNDTHDRRTYVLPGPAVQERLDILKGKTPSNTEVSPSIEPFTEEQMFSNNTIVFNDGKHELTLALERDQCTEAGSIADMVPKKRKSKSIREASHMESSKKKKRKMHKNSKDQKQLAEENDNMKECTEQTDKEMGVISSIQIKKQEPKIRRETYDVSKTKQDLVINDLVPKTQGVNYRRETFVITEPSPFVSVTFETSASEERNDTFIEPKKSVHFFVPKDFSCKNENGSDGKKVDCEKLHCNLISDPDDACEYNKHVPRCSEKKTSSGLFSELHKRNTHIVPNRQDDLRGEKVTLVRESLMNQRSSQSIEARKFPYITTKNDSFMLDMVSESILENTMEFSSFAEFPSATNPESTFTMDMSLKSIPELPVSEHCNNEVSYVLNNIQDLDENDNGHQQYTCETEIGTIQQCKVEEQTMEIHETAIKPFQDLTNKTLGSTKQSPKSYSEEDSIGHTRRRRNPVNYKEPSLGKKLRRGDQYTDTAFLSSPILKGRSKQGGQRSKQGGRQSKKCQD